MWTESVFVHNFLILRSVLRSSFIGFESSVEGLRCSKTCKTFEKLANFTAPGLGHQWNGVRHKKITLLATNFLKSFVFQMHKCFPNPIK